MEFIEPSEARKAFMKLAYSKFKNMPLYLEWAPENSLQPKSSKQPFKIESKNTSQTEPNTQLTNTQNDNLQNTDNPQNTNNPQESEEEEDPEPDTTLFVKNLNFETTDEGLKNHFKSCGKIYYANVATKKDKNDAKKKLSMGYGFIRFYHKASADKALKTMQQSNLDGKSLELKRSERTFQKDVVSTRKAQTKTKQTGTKLLVRNVPFQAKKSEIEELFKTFGEIKALRLPRKMTPGSDAHRGFAFVDFVTNSDAKVRNFKDNSRIISNLILKFFKKL